MTTDDGDLILKKGGKPELLNWIEENRPIKTIKFNKITYLIYSSGKVTYANGTTVLEEGGESELYSSVVP